MNAELKLRIETAIDQVWHYPDLIDAATVQRPENPIVYSDNSRMPSRPSETLAGS